MLLLQLAKSDEITQLIANVSKAQCALRVEHVEKGGSHITFIVKRDKRGQRHCNYEERAIDVSCHMTSSQVKHDETANP